MAELLTIQEAAVELGLSRKAIARRIERGAIQSLKHGGRRLIPGAEVERVRKLESKREKPQSQADSPLVGAEPRGGSGVPEFVEALERAHLENRELAVKVARLQLLTEQAESTEQQLKEEIFRLRAELAQAESALEVDVVDARPRRRLFARNRGRH